MSLKIAVAPASPDAGASFISCALALGLSSSGSCCLTEASDAYFYEALAFERRFVSREFSAYADKIRMKQNVSSVSNLEAGINWWLRMPSDRAAFAPAELFRLLYAPKDDYCVFDCSGMEENLAADFLAEADRALLVLDPLPTSLFRGAAFISRIRASLPDCRLVVNKMNRGVQRRELIRFLGTKDFTEVDALPVEVIYKAEYNGVFPSETGNAGELRRTQDILAKLFI